MENVVDADIIGRPNHRIQGSGLDFNDFSVFVFATQSIA